MNDISYTLVIFEIIPLEKLRLESVDNPVIVISNVLQKNGFSLIEQKNNGEIIFGIQDKICLEQLAKKSFAHWEDELIWLAIEFFEYLIIIPTKHDVLFGFASSNDPQQLSPQGRPPSYIVSEVGDYTYRPAIPRILIATALAEQGFTELIEAKKKNVCLNK